MRSYAIPVVVNHFAPQISRAFLGTLSLNRQVLKTRMHVCTCERVGKSGSLSICIPNLRAWPLQPSPRGPVSGVHSGASTSTGPVWLAVPPPRLYRFEQLMFAHGAVTFRTNSELPLQPAVATQAVA
jgi:hypothetical protein